MASRAKNLDFLPPCWLLSCLLGILPQCLLGVAIWIVGGLGTVDVKLHGFGVPKCRYFDGFGRPETWLKYCKYEVIVRFSHHGILLPKLSIFGHFRGLSQWWGKGVKRPDGLAREESYSMPAA